MLANRAGSFLPPPVREFCSHSRDITARPRLRLLADFAVHWPMLLFAVNYRERPHRQMENPEERYTRFTRVAPFCGERIPNLSHDEAQKRKNQQTRYGRGIALV